MFRITSKGNFRNLERFLKRMEREEHINQAFKFYGEKGVQALRSATPVDSGLTANSWTYEVVREGDRHSIHWVNTNVNNGVNIAIILQFGHGTGTGGYVAGRNYIPPAIDPIFDEIAEAIWKEVTKA